MRCEARRKARARSFCARGGRRPFARIFVAFRAAYGHAHASARGDGRASLDARIVNHERLQATIARYHYFYNLPGARAIASRRREKTGPPTVVPRLVASPVRSRDAEPEAGGDRGAAPHPTPPRETQPLSRTCLQRISCDGTGPGYSVYRKAEAEQGSR